MYIANVDLPEAGTWGAEFTTAAPNTAPETIRLSFTVLDTPTAVAVGQKAPASKTPTAADVGGDLTKVSTDAKPDPAFYQTSVAAASPPRSRSSSSSRRPKFCMSQQCGPTLDHFKPIAAAHPDVTFINVEPYKLEVVDGALQPVLDAQNQLIATDVSNEGPCSEPWIFAVDRNGIVRGSYESAHHRRRAGRDPAGHHRRRLARVAAGVLEPDGDHASPSRRYQTRIGTSRRLVLDEMAGREFDAILENADREAECGLVVVRSVEPGDPVDPGRGDDDPADAVAPPPGRRDSAGELPPRSTRGSAVTPTTATRRARTASTGATIHDFRCPYPRLRALPVPLVPGFHGIGCPSGTPGTSKPRLVGRAGRAPRAAATG